MLDVASFNEQIEREERLKRLGMFFLSLCALLFIAAVVYLAVQWGYVGTTRFTAFCVAAAVYLLCKWVVYLLLWRTASLVRPHQETFPRHRTFSSALGCGNVLFGRFHICPSWPSVSYSFLSLFFIPLIPTGCYDLSGTGKSVLSIGTEVHYFSLPIEWRAVEVLYIYAKCWSMATMILLLVVTFFDYVSSLTM